MGRWIQDWDWDSVLQEEEVWDSFKSTCKGVLKEGVGEKVIVVREEIRNRRKGKVWIDDEVSRGMRQLVREVLSELKEREGESIEISDGLVKRLKR